MAYNEVVEMLGENLASFLELTKKWLIEWGIDFKNLLHFFHNLKKDDLIGLLNGTHQIQMAVVSKVFKKTTVVNVAKNPKSFKIQEKSVMNFLELVIKREKELKNPTPYVDNDIWKYFKDQVIPGFVKDFSSVICRFLENLTHKQILDEAENLGIKKVYSFLEALSVIRQAILNGEVDEKGKGIVVYFEIKGNNSLYRFNAGRYGDGRLGVSVGKVHSGSTWDAGCGACFSN